MASPKQSSLGVQMNSRHSLIAHLGPGERIEGCYRFKGSRMTTTADGVVYWQVRLADRSGILTAYYRVSGTARMMSFPHDQLVFVAFRTHWHRNALIAELIECDPAIGEPEPALALDRLPCPDTGDTTVLDQLTALVQNLDSPVLRAALDQVLANDAVVFPWMRDAQKRFAQGVRAAGIAADLPYFGREERDLVVVASLLRSMRRHFHDGTPALRHLVNAWPRVARRLHQLLSLDTEPRRHDLPPALVHAAALAMALARDRTVAGSRWNARLMDA